MKTLQFRLIRTLWIGSLLVLSWTVFGEPRLLAQSQDDQSQSVAEAARKAKEQKKKAPAKNNTVITDDTLNLRPASYDTGAAPPAGTVINTTPVMPSTQGSAQNSAEPAKPADASASAATQTEFKKSEQAAEIAKEKELLKQMQSELDLLKRRLALDSDSFYSKPDYAHDSDGKAKLDELQRNIDDKKSYVDDLKKHLQELMQEAGISPDADKTPAPPQR